MQRSAEAVWDECLEIIRDNISRQSFKTWFEPLKPLSLAEEGGFVKLMVQLPSRFFFEWLEEHYFDLLRKTIGKVLGPQGRLLYNVNVVIDRQESQAESGTTSMQLPARADEREVRREHGSSGARAAASAERHGERYFAHYGEMPRGWAAAPSSAHSGEATSPFVAFGEQRAPLAPQLNPTYTFERFIEGDCNRLARSAALAIAQRPGSTAFNPFLIYGGVGLGKTHLIQAIGHFALKHPQVERVLYVSSERFTNEFVQSIQHNRVSDFSRFYREIDLLIVDDVQFFSGREKTQEEFFHIFNTLHQDGKQIILSADRPPREIQGIEERLLSRFQWGLTADVQLPELETRIAILQRKAEDEGFQLADNLIEFVAHNIKSNIRELEGALIRLMAHATLHDRELDLPRAREVLRDMIKDIRVNLTIEEIQRVVCEYFNISEDLVRAKTRKREVVQARQVAMYFSKDLTQHSLKTIGLHFGGRDHSTVIHAIQSIENQIETDPKFREMIEEVRRKLELRSR